MKARIDAFEQGLRELGYVDGQNAVVEYRFADGKVDRLSALASELIQFNASVIVTEGTTATRYAKQATSIVPIVMAQDPDPVGMGFAASLARPGGNITGLSNRPNLAAQRCILALVRPRRRHGELDGDLSPHWGGDRSAAQHRLLRREPTVCLVLACCCSGVGEALAHYARAALRDRWAGDGDRDGRVAHAPSSAARRSSATPNGDAARP
jgi:hypothetical protein